MSSLTRLFTTLPFLGRRKPAGDGDVPIEQVGWDEFERLVVEGFLRRGYHRVGGSPRASSIGNDLVLRRDRETYLVYCQSWRSRKIGLSTVRGVQAALEARHANGGFIVTFGRFGREATRFAGAQRIQLLDGPALKALIEPVRKSLRSAGDPPDLPAGSATAPRAVPQSPACPNCGKLMKLRTAKRGAHAGHGFWGCMDAPDCKGIRPLV